MDDIILPNDIIKVEIVDTNDQYIPSTEDTTKGSLAEVIPYIKIEKNVINEGVFKKEKMDYDQYKPTLPKVIPIHGIKVENNENLSFSDATNVIDHTTYKYTSSNIPIHSIKVESDENLSFSDAADITDHTTYKSTSSNIPIHGIKVETLDVTYDRPIKTNNATDMYKVQSVKNIDIINQGINNTQDKTVLPTLPKFVSVQSIKFENDYVNQGIENCRTNYVNVSGLPKENGNEYSRSSDVMHEGFLAYEDFSEGSLPSLKIDEQKDNDTDGRLSFDNKVYCTLCPYQTNNEKLLSYHLKAHAAIVSYKCNICSYMTINKYRLTFHHKIHTSDKSHSCSVCDKTFNSKGDLDRHFRTHSGEKPFQCDICNKAFTDGTGLRNYLRRHSGEKPYSCDICNKTFTQRGTLTSHLKTHSRKKPYSYEVCKKSYGYKISLTNHVRIHTGEVLHWCGICNKAFSSNGTLKTHFLLHTGKKPYSCNVCNKSFKLNTQLTRHLKNAHPDEIADTHDMDNSIT